MAANIKDWYPENEHTDTLDRFIGKRLVAHHQEAKHLLRDGWCPDEPLHLEFEDGTELVLSLRQAGRLHVGWWNKPADPPTSYAELNDPFYRS